MQHELRKSGDVPGENRGLEIFVKIIINYEFNLVY